MENSIEASSPSRVAQPRFKLRWLLAALLSASLAVWATIWCLADILQTNAIAMLYVGLESSANQVQWRRGWARLKDARKLNPMHAEYPFYQAYFSHNRALEASAQQGEPSGDRNQSFDYFNQALRIRPHWGYVWAQFAEASLANGDGSEETFSALDKALLFSPYEPFVLHIALRVGFAFWDRLDEGLRQKLFSAVRYLLRHDPRFVIETALLFEWTEQLRPLLSDDRDIELLNSRLADRRNSFAAE